MMLSILTVTKLEPHSAYFLGKMRDLALALSAEFVVVVDGETPVIFPDADRVGVVQSKGYIESVLDEAVNACRGRYILRLDDDEMASPAMERWLAHGCHLTADNWQFPRAHLWPDAESVIMTPHLWPDMQTRLSVKEKAGGRGGVHAGSPFGMGEYAPVTIEHHKFLARTYEERLAIAKRYDAYSAGYGTGNMKPFSLPEDAYDEVTVVKKGDGAAPWDPSWTKRLSMRRDHVA